MRTILNSILIVMMLPLTSYAQGNIFNELFRQKSTQRQYLANQIAAFKVYNEYLKQGYNIYKTGHDAIAGFKRGEFNLHKAYFRSLKDVNPEIARYSRISDIRDLQKSLLKVCSSTLDAASEDGFIHGEELSYIAMVYSKLYEDCEGLLDELSLLLKSETFEMGDAQRLTRIDELYLEMKDKYQFAATFSSGIVKLQLSRKKEQQGIQLLKQLYE
jgi:hypothetical protein